jgi:hypothetical protein
MTEARRTVAPPFPAGHRVCLQTAVHQDSMNVFETSQASAETCAAPSGLLDHPACGQCQGCSRPRNGPHPTKPVFDTQPMLGFRYCEKWRYSEVLQEVLGFVQPLLPVRVAEMMLASVRRRSTSLLGHLVPWTILTSGSSFLLWRNLSNILSPI